MNEPLTIDELFVELVGEGPYVPMKKGETIAKK